VNQPFKEGKTRSVMHHEENSKNDAKPHPLLDHMQKDHSNRAAHSRRSKEFEAVQPEAILTEVTENPGPKLGKKPALNRTVRIGGEGPKPSASTPPIFNRSELIICHARSDLAATDVVSQIANQKVEHTDLIENMDERVGFEPGPKAPDFQLHLIGVPAGEEIWKANYLQFVYKQALMERLRMGAIAPDFAAALGRADLQFSVQPNHEIHLAAAAASAPTQAVSAAHWRFTEYHQQYKSMLRIPAMAENPEAVNIAVLDTGVAPDLFPGDSSQFKQNNLVDADGKGNSTAADNHGHGTMICSIIRDVAPFANLHVFKVFGDNGRTTEWHILNALQMLCDANIVNMSLTFGMLAEVTCSECGHKSGLDVPLVHSHRARSNAFHNQMRQLVEREGRVLVAAAGNSGRDEFEYPARFEEVFAITSVNGRCERSSFSNYNGSGIPHPLHFALPGGDTTDAADEIIGYFTSRDGIGYGTSHAAAYASGLLAHLWHRAKPEGRNSRGMIEAMRRAARSQFGTLTKYNVAEHGHGIPGLA
jgi:subtilisin family serine protease